MTLFRALATRFPFRANATKARKLETGLEVGMSSPNSIDFDMDISLIS